MQLQPATRRSAPWLVLAALAGVVLAMRLQLGFDLSAFLPRQSTFEHDILLEQLRNGPGSRLMVIGIGGVPHGELRVASDRLRGELAAHPAFETVQNGELAEADAAVPEPIRSYYLLLDDIDYSAASIDDALQSRLRDFGFGGGAAFLDLVARDPFLVTLRLLDQVAPVDADGELWFAENGNAVLMAATHAPSTDLAAQAEAVSAVRAATAAVAPEAALELEITGVGAFGVELQDTIRGEARKLSVLAAGALCLVLLVVYRSPRLLLLAALPIGMGSLVGLTLVSLVFDKVHGITLAFGFTLLGVAIDYPLHLFSHARLGGGTAIRGIWPTLRLGALSTGIAYAALALSGSEGLAQLGMFTAGGLLVAALATRYWLPVLLVQRPSPPGPPAAVQRASLSHVPAVVLLALALAMSQSLDESGFWDDRLASLSPVPGPRLQKDAALRSAAGTPDMRYQIVMHDSSLESLLIAGETAAPRLDEAVGNGLLASWQSVSRLLPSQQLQAARQDAVPAESALRARLDDATRNTPFHADAFAPFVSAAAAAKRLPPLGVEHFAGTPLQPWLDSHLVHTGGRWVSLTSLSDPQAPELAERLSSWGNGAALVDLQEASVELVQGYRNGATRTVAFAALFIVVLLWTQRRQPAQVLWIGLTVASALTMTAIVAFGIHGPLTVIHLVALLLVLGLGLDYALFLSRAESGAERRATNQAVLACAASTTIAFGVLATSTIPVLKYVGMTVAVGSATSYLLAVIGSRWQPYVFRRLAKSPSS